MRFVDTAKSTSSEINVSTQAFVKFDLWIFDETLMCWVYYDCFFIQPSIINNFEFRANDLNHTV